MKQCLYQANYYGPFGKGTAAFRVRNSEIVGIDVAGAEYHGVITKDEETGKERFTLVMRAPDGAFLVTDGVPRSSNELIPLELEFEENDLDKPIALSLHYGQVTVTIHFDGDIVAN